VINPIRSGFQNEMKQLFPVLLLLLPSPVLLWAADSGPWYFAARLGDLAAVKARLTAGVQALPPGEIYDYSLGCRRHAAK